MSANSRLLTLQTLIEKKACKQQVLLFKKLFGDSVLITEQLCVKYAGKFDFDWAACNLLSPEGYEAYETAVKLADEAYETAVKSANESYDVATKLAYEAYDAAVNSAREVYKVEKAKAFANAYINDGKE